MKNNEEFIGLTFIQKFYKRTFDLTISSVGLFIIWWIILISYILASNDTKQDGFFKQPRVGKNGKLFNIIKIRTMRFDDNISTVVTTSKDLRITRLGQFWRKSKIDELPQLINVFKGEMSFVGPRPDVQGFADNLEGDDRLILHIRPGITGPATIKYRNEEQMLSSVAKPELYNANVIYPDKVNINLQYIRNFSFINDIKLILQTVFSRQT